MIAGPSEVVVLADSSADPRFRRRRSARPGRARRSGAVDSRSPTTRAWRARSRAAVEAQLADLPRAKIAGASWRDYGAIILVDELSPRRPLVDRLAPEHLEIIARDADALSAAIDNAGAIFLGPHTPEAIGDYVGGSNHVLPTSRSARFSSGLGVLDFVKRTSILKCDARSLAALGPAAVRSARPRVSHAHARSVALRLARDGAR